jgi:hypothetical protein
MTLVYMLKIVACVDLGTAFGCVCAVEKKKKSVLKKLEW